MKIVSWNVNGLRAVMRKPQIHHLVSEDAPDILCLQEIKCDDKVAQSVFSLLQDTYPFVYYNTSKTKKGYSGTAILSRTEATKVSYDLPNHDNDEGRVTTCWFKGSIDTKVRQFVLVNVYTPNSGSTRLQYRTQEWDVAFRQYICTLQQDNKNVIVCGDLNVAHNEIDIHSPKTNKKSAGYTDEERKCFEALLAETGMIDTFRHQRPSETKYSWWSTITRSRESNKGWRIDYFLVSKNMKKKYQDSDILVDVYGSDHAPVVLTL
jgi:exodeoxyribonuclease-3